LFYTVFIRLFAALDCKPHLNIAYVSLRYFRVLACVATLLLRESTRFHDKKTLDTQNPH